MFELDVREGDGGEAAGVVGADAKAQVYRAVEGEHGRGDAGECAVVGARKGGKGVAAALDANAGSRTWRGGYVLRLAGARAAELEGNVAVAVDGDVGVRRGGIERLADEEDAFFEREDASGGKGDVGGQGSVAGEAGPGEVEGVGGAPHVRAAASEAVVAGGGIIGGGTFLRCADVDGVREERVGGGWLGKKEPGGRRDGEQGENGWEGAHASSTIVHLLTSRSDS